jgi:hypothetical protein
MRASRITAKPHCCNAVLERAVDCLFDDERGLSRPLAPVVLRLGMIGLLPRSRQACRKLSLS